MLRNDYRVLGMQREANARSLGWQTFLASAIGRDAHINLAEAVVLNDNQNAVALIDYLVDMARQIIGSFRHCTIGDLQQLGPDHQAMAAATVRDG